MAAAVLQGEGKQTTHHHSVQHFTPTLPLAIHFHIDLWYLLCHLRLINDPHDIQASNSASILGGLSLCVIEVGRHRHNCVCY